ncbi:MAG: hypothetical protein P8L39_06765 [Halioglobus sp.]|nr:hypothetical protein [Halioglobus sp.]
MMNLLDIQPALQCMANNQIVTDLRSHTYLSSYPDILAFAGGGAAITPSNFRQISLMVYGWMPRVLRLNPIHFQNAVNAAARALTATTLNYQTVPIQHIADCMHSLVGASKLLHFINPHVFAIWDSRIQAFRNLPNDNNAMSNIENYYAYMDEVHNIVADPNFNLFYQQYNQLLSARLLASNIPVYNVGQIRAVEGSAFELA